MSENAQTLYEQAMAYCDNQKWDQAIEAFSRALSLAENDSSPLFKADIYNGRGVAYAHRNDYDQAIEDFSKALELQPAADRAVTYANRGTARIEKGDYEYAVSDSGKVPKLKRDCCDQAIEDLNKALELQPKRADVYYNLGYAHLLKEEHKEALEHFLKAGEHNPKLVVEDTLCYIASKIAAASKVAASQ